jgi:hypothetical protein
MKLRIEHGLLFADATLTYRGRVLQLNNVMLDTGSAGTLFSIDQLTNIGLQYEPNDAVHRIRGVGGTEFVFTKRLQALALGDLQLRDFVVEVGAMDYGLNVDGIIGLDFLARVGAIIDMAALELRGVKSD